MTAGLRGYVELNKYAHIHTHMHIHTVSKLHGLSETDCYKGSSAKAKQSRILLPVLVHSAAVWFAVLVL